MLFGVSASDPQICAAEGLGAGVVVDVDVHVDVVGFFGEGGLWSYH